MFIIIYVFFCSIKQRGIIEPALYFEKYFEVRVCCGKRKIIGLVYTNRNIIQSFYKFYIPA
jgi:hypothetical protein